MTEPEAALLYIFLWFLGMAVFVLIVYLVIRYAVLHALQIHDDEKAKRAAKPHPTAATQPARPVVQRPAGYKGAQVLSPPE